VGLFDRAKQMLGFGGQAPDEAEAPRRGKSKEGRPPLKAPVAPSATLEDALAARESGAQDQARAILEAIDRGQGLRTVIRAAAALEAADEEGLLKLLPAVAAEQPAWQLPLQVAAAIDDDTVRARLVERATRLGAPRWALAWVGVSSKSEEAKRRALVDLLFEDAPLARTVAARELAIAGASADSAAVRRFTAFAHGRDVMRRFGPSTLVALLDRVSGAE
jgi:hypothetical protein